MSLSRDVLLFSIVLMLWAVQIEASGYGSSGTIVISSVGIAVVGLAGSFLRSVRSASRTTGADSSE